MIMMTDYQLLKGRTYDEKGKRTFLEEGEYSKKIPGENLRPVQVPVLTATTGRKSV